jgi:hypothetical protein
MSLDGSLTDINVKRIISIAEINAAFKTTAEGSLKES